MPVIACKLGHTQQTVGGATYVFNFDEAFGDYVAHVHNLAHAACFLSVVHYQEAVRDEVPNREAKGTAVRAGMPEQGHEEQEAVSGKTTNGETDKEAVSADASFEAEISQEASLSPEKDATPKAQKKQSNGRIKPIMNEA